jgi:hypothetical protein
MYAIGRSEFEANFQRFAANSNGRALLEERPSLIAALSDREALARMPDATLGRAYLDYLARNGFAPDGLLAVHLRVQACWESEEGPRKAGSAPHVVPRPLDRAARSPARAHGLRHGRAG